MSECEHLLAKQFSVLRTSGTSSRILTLLLNNSSQDVRLAAHGWKPSVILIPNGGQGSWWAPPTLAHFHDHVLL